jgi:hypothetical protein
VLLCEGSAPASAPTGGGFTWFGSSAVKSISCPSASRCVALSAELEVFSFVDPGRHNQHLNATQLLRAPGPAAPLGGGGIACPSSSLCFAAAGEQIWSSTQPADAGSWSSSIVLRPGREFDGIA